MRKKAIQGPEAYKIGKTKRTVSLVLLTGICLLYSKGIIPVYLLVLFLLSGTLISLLFRTFTLIVKIIIALTVMGMLV